MRNIYYSVILLAVVLVLSGAAGQGGPRSGGPGDGRTEGEGGPFAGQGGAPNNTTGGGPGGPGNGRGEGPEGPNNGTVRTNAPAGGPGGNGQGKPDDGGSQGGARNQTGGPSGPRGDDARQRNWGMPNDRNETEFDDRKSPRKVAFMGKSANVRIYPNYSDTSVFLQLRFARIAELDAYGRLLPYHQVASLADASDAVNFTSGNRTIGTANASYVRVTLSPLLRQEFRNECFPPVRDGGDGEDGSSSRPPSPPPMPPRPPAPAPGLQPRVTVELLFGLDDAVTLPYGDTNVTVPRNGLKWTISYSNWPFCNDSNSLMVSLDLILSNNGSYRVTPGGAGQPTSLTLSLSSDYNASLSFLDYALDLVNGTIKMPVNVSVPQPPGGPARTNVLSVNTVLPNPKTRNASSVWYDPTSTTTSVFLSTTDPGNGYINTTTTNGTPDGGSAAGVRMTVWAALAAVLLSVFLTAP